MSGKSINKRVRVRAIALPLEHGAWGFVLEPLAAGLILAPTGSGAWIALFVFCLFLLRQPLKILLADRIAGRNLPQTVVAIKFILGYLVLALLGAVQSWTTAPTSSFLPFAMVIPLAIYQIYCDATRKSRQLIPEMTSTIAISSSVAAILLAGGWTFTNAFAVWGILLARFIPSTLYVRARLRRKKGKDISAPTVIGAHLVATFGVALLAINGISPLLPVPVMAVLLVRAALGLSSYRKKLRAVQIGIREVVYGGMVVLSIVIGYYFDL